MENLVLTIPSSIGLTDDQFFELCIANQNLHLERTRFGDILVTPPTGSETGNRNFNFALQLGIWAEQDGTGLCFDSSTGFKLPNGAERSPDVAWVLSDRWNALTLEQQQTFAPICPDFVVELRSPSDSLTTLQEKMIEYSEQPGFRLGLLIDRKNRCIYVYRLNQAVQQIQNPAAIDCSPELPGFVVNLSKVW